MTQRLSVVALSLVFAAVIAQPSRAEWQPPKDGLMTEKQVNGYFQVTKEVAAALERDTLLTQGDPDAKTAAAVLAAADARRKTALAKAGIDEKEFQWIGERVSEAERTLYTLAFQKRHASRLAETLKKNGRDQAAAKQKVAEYEQAMKEGRKTPPQDGGSDKSYEQRLAQAKAEVQRLEDEVTEHQNVAARIAKDVAELLAKCPPRHLEMVRKHLPVIEELMKG